MSLPTRGTASVGHRWVLRLSGLLTAVGLGVVGLVVTDPPAPRNPAIITNGSATPAAPGLQTAAPQDAARRVHDSVHALGRICKPGATNLTPRVRPHVETVLNFARRYPDASFPIHDETGTAVSLLLVTREGLRTCAPPLVDSVNQALPPQYRSSGAPS